MWVTQENLAAGNNQLTPRKPRKVNTDNLKVCNSSGLN
jgi:hypothetical protein